MRFLVTGAGGQLGSEIVEQLTERDANRARDRFEVIAAGRSRLDVSDRDAVLAAVTGCEPDVIFHAAAWTAVDDCESDPDRAFALNALAVRHVAEAARITGSHVVIVSTDYVFDGTRPEPYKEWDEPNPVSVYGRSKLGGEREADPSFTVARTSWVSGKTGSNVVKTVMRAAARSKDELRFVSDQYGSPTMASDLAGKLIDLGLSRRPGMFHVTNSGAATWYQLAREVCRLAGADPERVVPISTGDLIPPRAAVRPANSVLDNAALRASGDQLLPAWQDSLAGLVRQLL